MARMTSRFWPGKFRRGSLLAVEMLGRDGTPPNPHHGVCPKVPLDLARPDDEGAAGQHPHHDGNCDNYAKYQPVTSLHSGLLAYGRLKPHPAPSQSGKPSSGSSPGPSFTLGFLPLRFFGASTLPRAESRPSISTSAFPPITSASALRADVSTQ